MSAVTKELILKLDELVEKVDYDGTPADDERLANAICEHWPDLELALRQSIGATADEAYVS